MKKTIFFLVIMLSAFYSCNMQKSKDENKVGKAHNKKLVGKKVAMIIASKDFNETELDIPKSIFVQNGMEVSLYSSVTEAVGMNGKKVKTNILDDSFPKGEFSVVVLVGGNGCNEYFNNGLIHLIVNDAIYHNNILGAICMAPVILAKAGVLTDKNATCYQPLLISEQGAKISPEPVVVDGNIVTANGPDASSDFAEAIIKLILKQ